MLFLCSLDAQRLREFGHGADIVASVNDGFTAWEGHIGDAGDLLVDVGIDLALLAQVLIECVEGVMVLVMALVASPRSTRSDC